ncbi:MAG: ROK family transcriptional regulator, partial [Myxococcales bacterium]
MSATVKQRRSGGRPATLAVIRAFDALCDLGPLTRGHLGDALEASPSTITAAVRELEARGYVAEIGAAQSTGGRKPRVLDLAVSLGSVLAADLGAINVRIAAADVRGRILERCDFPTPQSSDSNVFRRRVLQALSRVARSAPKPVHALTLGVAGIVDEYTREVSFATLPGWPSGDPARWLRRLGVPVLIENEANLAAMGEYAHGADHFADSLLFVAIGAGIGAGLMIRGELYRGATGAAGEIGFLRRDLSSPPGQLEREAAAAAAVRLYRAAGGEPALATAEEVFASAGMGEPAARAAVATIVDELALGLANAIAL